MDGPASRRKFVLGIVFLVALPATDCHPLRLLATRESGIAMSLARAIARGYRYFVPRSLLHPRQLVREFYQQAFIYVLGITTGMYSFCGPDQAEHVTYWSIAAMLTLYLVKWWAGPDGSERPPEA